LTGESVKISAKIFINCTGASADVVRQLANPSSLSRIRPSKGVHLVLPADVLKGNAHALMIPKTADGRLIFVLPFEHSVFVGTTDDDYKTPDKEPILNRTEVDFILETLRPYFENRIESHQITAGFGGLRPLITENKANTKNLLRDHEVEHDPVSNLVSLLGGKWTTYRIMAKDTIDKVETILKSPNAPTDCKTADYVLVGGEDLDEHKIIELIDFIAEKYNLSNAIAAHLVSKYGNLAEKVIQMADEKGFEHLDLLSPLTPQYPHLKAEVLYAVRHEMAMKPRDFLARRTRLEIMNWQVAHDVCPTVCQIMSIELRWTAAKMQQEIMDYQQQIKTFQAAIQ
jgi:glycerol-3-phosphate dehydrogenase